MSTEEKTSVDFSKQGPGPAERPTTMLNSTQQASADLDSFGVVTSSEPTRIVERMDFTEQFHRRAAACAEVADTSSDTNDARSWLRLAKEWLLLAEQLPALKRGRPKSTQSDMGR